LIDRIATAVISSASNSPEVLIPVPADIQPGGGSCDAYSSEFAVSGITFNAIALFDIVTSDIGAKYKLMGLTN